MAADTMRGLEQNFDPRMRNLIRFYFGLRAEGFSQCNSGTATALQAVLAAVLVANDPLPLILSPYGGSGGSLSDLATL